MIHASVTFQLNGDIVRGEIVDKTGDDYIVALDEEGTLHRLTLEQIKLQPRARLRGIPSEDFEDYYEEESEQEKQDRAERRAHREKERNEHMMRQSMERYLALVTVVNQITGSILKAAEKGDL
jgi:hypothetical protein